MKRLTTGMSLLSVLFGYLITLTTLTEFRGITYAQTPQSQVAAPANTATSDTNLNLEQQKLMLEERKIKVEEQKLSDGRFTAILTAVAIIVPVLSGLVFIYLQARTAAHLKEVESDVAFQLQAAEIVMSSQGTRMAGERAAALRLLFPKRIPAEFVQVFDKKNFKLPGMAYQEKKLELFKTLATTAKDKKEVFQLYGMLYADEENVITEFIDKWSHAYPDDAEWVEEFVERWKQAYPKGKWEKTAKLNA